MNDLHDIFDRFHWTRLHVDQLRRRQVDHEERDLEMDELRERVDQLATVNLALWEILRDELGISDQRLSEQLERIVARRAGAEPVGGRTCSSCGRKVPASRERCLYCGVGFE